MNFSFEELRMQDMAKEAAGTELQPARPAERMVPSVQASSQYEGHAAEVLFRPAEPTNVCWLSRCEGGPKPHWVELRAREPIGEFAIYLKDYSSYSPRSVEIKLRRHYAGFVAAIRQHIAPGIDDERVPVAFSASGDRPHGAGRN